MQQTLYTIGTRIIETVPSVCEVRLALPNKHHFTFDVTRNGTGVVSWGLVEASVLKTMNGSYTLSAKGSAGTTVTYRLAVDVKIPMLGMLKRKAEKVIIDTALKELKKRVEG